MLVQSPDPTPPGRSEEQPHLDETRIRVLRDLLPQGSDYLARAIGNFLTNSTAVEAVLRRAVVEGDAETLAFHAHSLKGSAANLGLVRVAAAAETLQRRGDDGDLAGVEPELDELLTLLEHGRAALREQQRSDHA